MKVILMGATAPRALCGLLLVSLAACGGGSGGGMTAATDTTATSTAYGAVSGAPVTQASYDASSDTVTVSNGAGVSTILAHDTTYDGVAPGFKLYDEPSRATDTAMVLGKSASGDLMAGVGVVYDPAGTGPASIGGVVSRQSDGTIPNSGSASFSGTYAALLQNPGMQNRAEQLVVGDASLSADFGSGAVSGRITNRRTGASSPSPLNDLVLSGGTIGANGSFSGTATGGGLLAASDVTSNGSFTGLFGGNNGSEAAGGIQITHTDPAGTGSSIETGAFIASQ